MGSRFLFESSETFKEDQSLGVIICILVIIGSIASVLTELRIDYLLQFRGTDWANKEQGIVFLHQILLSFVYFWYVFQYIFFRIKEVSFRKALIQKLHLEEFETE